MSFDACQCCMLTASHPMAHLDESGLCSPCRRGSSTASSTIRREQLLACMENLFAKTRQRGGRRVLLALSGGKDSSWTLVQLKQRYGLDVCALTLDNGFLSDGARANAESLTSALGVEHIVVRPPFELLRRLFVSAMTENLYPPTALTRASSVCNACIAVVKSACLREALARKMDVTVWGWSPGQAPLASAFFRPGRELVASMVEGWSGPLSQAVGESARELCVDLDAEFPDVRMPYFVSPLALIRRSEEEMIAELAAFGWTAPQDVDAHSTNCRLNALASHEHCVRHGFHPYALETAGLLREGLLDRDVARQRLAGDPDRKQLVGIADELQLDVATRRELGLLDLNGSTN